MLLALEYLSNQSLCFALTLSFKSQVVCGNSPEQMRLQRGLLMPGCPTVSSVGVLNQIPCFLKHRNGKPLKLTLADVLWGLPQVRLVFNRRIKQSMPQMMCHDCKRIWLSPPSPWPNPRQHSCGEWKIHEQSKLCHPSHCSRVAGSPPQAPLQASLGPEDSFCCAW